MNFRLPTSRLAALLAIAGLLPLQLPAAALQILPIEAQEVKPDADTPGTTRMIKMNADGKAQEVKPDATTFTKADGITLKVGDPAPALKTAHWLKGTPITEFKKGQVYVLEFWATWCGPCKAAIPHITELAKKYEGKVTFIGMNIWEKAKSPKELDQLVDKFVKDMGDKMGYSVAQDSRDEHMAKAWMKAAGRFGIPASFIVGLDGRIAWQGHPEKLDEVLGVILKGTFGVADGKAAEKAEAQAEKDSQEASSAMKAALPAINKARRAKDWAQVLRLADETQAKLPNSISLRKMLGARRIEALGHTDPTKVQPFIESQLGAAKAIDYLGAAGSLWELRSAVNPRWGKLALSYLDKASSLDPGLVKRESVLHFGLLVGVDDVKARQLWEAAKENIDDKAMMAMYLPGLDGVGEPWLKEAVTLLEALKKESGGSVFDRYLAQSYFKLGRVKDAVIAQMGYVDSLLEIKAVDVTVVIAEAKADLATYQLALKK